MPARTLRILLVDGSPTGIRTAEMGLSTIKVLVAPRDPLHKLQERPEATRTGVYILVGDDPDHFGRLMVYVGEGDNVFRRIKDHDASKEFWNTVYIFVSKDDNLTKAHVRILESSLVALAKSAKRATVVNGNAPLGGGLPELDLADMEQFLEQILLLVGTLGLDVFQPALADGMAQSAGDNKVDLTLAYQGAGFAAKCRVSDGTFVVLKGSTCRVQVANSIAESTVRLRKALVESGVLIQEGQSVQFTQDYAFGSASAAAQVVSGSTVNGRSAWKLEDGRTYAEWDEAQLAAAADYVQSAPTVEPALPSISALAAPAAS